VSLRTFIEKMEAKREIIHVKDRVSDRFEVSSIIKAFDGGPILFFDNVKGSKTKIVANVSGTRQRLCSALKVAPEKLYLKLTEAWKTPVKPKIVQEAPVREVVEKPRLSQLSILTHFEKDPGPYITAAIVSAKSLTGEIENVSFHRLLVLDDNHLTLRLVPRQLFQLWETAKEAGEDLPVAISIGLHPAVSVAASSSVPFGVSEFGIANALLGGELQLVKGEMVDAYGPADAEMILEGVVSVKEEVVEGPFGDITGTYDIPRKQPVIEVLNVMHRKDYIYQALLPAGTEHRLLMGLPRETMIWEAVSKDVPKVKAVNLSVGGCAWLHAILSIEKDTEEDGKNVLKAAFTAHPSLKHAVVVDADIDVFNLEEVEWAIATRFQASDDMIIIPNVQGSSLDPSADQETGLTTKLGVDATRPLAIPRENFEKAIIPTSTRIAEEIKKLQEIYS
jgi:2,5-furandicarboxylate decarboxylase 1